MEAAAGVGSASHRYDQHLRSAIDQASAFVISPDLADELAKAGHQQLRPAVQPVHVRMDAERNNLAAGAGK